MDGKVVEATASIAIALLVAYGIVVLRIRGGFTIFMIILIGDSFPAPDVHHPAVPDVQLAPYPQYPLGFARFLHSHLCALLHAGPAGLFSTVPSEHREADIVAGASEARILRSIYARCRCWPRSCCSCSSSPWSGTTCCSAYF